MKRSLYYWSKLYTSQLEQGMPYRSLRKTIAINLLDFQLFPHYDDMHTVGQFWSRQHKEVLLEDLEIHFIEIPKLLRQWREEKLIRGKMNLLVGYFYYQRMKMNI